MKTKLKLIAISHLLSAVCLSAFAQGTAFTYQGRLNDRATPANGSFDLSFTLYDASVAGAAIAGPVTNSAVVVSNGLFTTTVDFGAGSFDGSDRWLEIGVRTNGDLGNFATLSPRQQITSSPYAIQSANAANAAVAASANSVSAANIKGTVALAQLPLALVTNGASGVSLNGAFTGDAGALTNVQLSAVGPDGTFSLLSLSFAPAITYNVGAQPQSVTAADVNGDGHVDLISANTGGYDSGVGNTLTVLTNDGSGNFVIASSPVVGGGPISVVAADVNGDGHVDLVSANGNDGTLTVLTNDGSGNFVIASSPIVGNGPASVTAADVNGDGHVDLITANGNNTSTLTVLTNNGSGVFGFNATLTVGYWPESVTAADVNGDGKLDLISASGWDNALTVLTNNGSGIFGLNATLPVGTWPESVTAADVNGNGHVDLISANTGGYGLGNTLTVLTNDGSGNFAIAFSPVVGGGPKSVVAADVNGDGHVDLISVNFGNSSDIVGYGSGNTLTVLTNDGSGGFAIASSPVVGGGPHSVTAADVNGDGHVDLITANFGYDNGYIYAGNTLTVLLNLAGGLSAPGAVSLTDRANTFAGSFEGAVNGSVSVSPGSSIRLNDQPLYLRGGSDVNHGLAYGGNGIFGTVRPDGPVLWGFSGGVLGTASAGQKAILSWDTTGVSVNGSITGDGTALTNLNASQLTSGTVPLTQLPSVVVTNGESDVSLGAPFSVNAGAAGTVTVRNENLVPALVITNGNAYSGYLRFRNHLEIQPNDAGTASGYLDVRNTSGTATISLNGQNGKVTANGLKIGANGTAFSQIESGQANMPPSSTVETNLTILFPAAFSSSPKILVSVANDPAWQGVNDTFVVSVSSNSPSAFRVNVVRVDAATGWSQQLRINWQAWQ